MAMWSPFLDPLFRRLDDLALCATLGSALTSCARSISSPRVQPICTSPLEDASGDVPAQTQVRPRAPAVNNPTKPLHRRTNKCQPRCASFLHLVFCNVSNTSQPWTATPTATDSRRKQRHRNFASKDSVLRPRKKPPMQPTQLRPLTGIKTCIDVLLTRTLDKAESDSHHLDQALAL